MIVCRRVEDTPANFRGVLDNCSKCLKAIFVERGVEEEKDARICIHCCAQEHPDTTVFVELPPDEFGCRSIPVTAKEMFEADSGEWHKSGMWHDAKYVLAHQ